MIKTAKSFLGDDFLLEHEAAVQLYEQYAAPMPIVDYHNHLSPKDIAQNRKFSNLTEAWLEGDHYKWRAMRINGVAEKFCTGNALPFEKFREWSKTVPYTMRNPLYHWTHLELKNYFGIRKLLDETTAKEVYDECSALLKLDEFSVRGLLSKMNVQVVCTTDDPIDSLEFHQPLPDMPAALVMYPTFRPDKAYGSSNMAAYNDYLDKLEQVSGVSIQSLEDLHSALNRRIKHFDLHGCRGSDHGQEFLFFDPESLSKAPAIFKKVRGGTPLSPEEQLHLRSAVMTELCRQYHKLGWVQQFHVGALRNANTRMMRLLGPDTGFDSVGDFDHARHTARFLDHLDTTEQLAKTILYNVNPSDNEIFATMAGNFSDGSVPGKVQFGSGWWFMDQKDGMKRQLNALSNMSLLSRFVGMVTDSRSFLSFPRHEYFRRILCNLIGKDIAKGELPDDLSRTGKMVQDICYHNVKSFFRI